MWTFAHPCFGLIRSYNVKAFSQQSLTPMLVGYWLITALPQGNTANIKDSANILVYKLKPLETIGNCQRLVFTVGVS